MRYKIDCKSLLLQKALEIFLEPYLDNEGLVISDYKGDIIIGKDIKKPFSKSQLLLQLENLQESPQIDMKIFEELDLEFEKQDDINTQEIIKTSTFDEKLDNLINDFSQKLKKLIKEEYGKK